MVEIYVDLIMEGYKTINQVPLRIRDKVKARLIEMGLPELAEEQTEGSN